MNSEWVWVPLGIIMWIPPLVLVWRCKCWRKREESPPF